MEALRQFKFERKNDVAVVHLTLLPYLSATGELKTKPTQHSVKTMLQSGVQPDVIVCRSEQALTESVKHKIALFCNIEYSSVIESVDVDTIYEVPIKMLEQKLDSVVSKILGFKTLNKINNSVWKKRLKKIKHSKNDLVIGIIGKYVELKDSYKSIFESITHASAFLGLGVSINWIQSDQITHKNIAKEVAGCHGVIIAPGFGDRGINGKIIAVQYARENNVPFLGICLGMQIAVIEFLGMFVGIRLHIQVK